MTVPVRLSNSEYSTLLLVSLGLTNAGIAKRLGLSAHTVKSHLLYMGTAFNSNGRAHLVRLGFHEGFLTIGQDLSRPALPAGTRHIAACFHKGTCVCPRRDRSRS